MTGASVQQHAAVEVQVAGAVAGSADRAVDPAIGDHRDREDAGTVDGGRAGVVVVGVRQNPLSKATFCPIHE